MNSKEKWRNERNRRIRDKIFGESKVVQSKVFTRSVRLVVPSLKLEQVFSHN